jgi:hypothetical protein
MAKWDWFTKQRDECGKETVKMWKELQERYDGLRQIRAYTPGWTWDLEPTGYGEGLVEIWRKNEKREGGPAWEPWWYSIDEDNSFLRRAAPCRTRIRFP